MKETKQTMAPKSKKKKFNSWKQTTTQQATTIRVQTAQTKYDQGIQCQFSSRLKTIVIIPVGSRGVIQFGSTKKIWEQRAQKNTSIYNGKKFQFQLKACGQK